MINFKEFTITTKMATNFEGFMMRILFKNKPLQINITADFEEQKPYIDKTFRLQIIMTPLRCFKHKFNEPNEIYEFNPKRMKTAPWILDSMGINLNYNHDFTYNDLLDFNNVVKTRIQLEFIECVTNKEQAIKNTIFIHKLNIKASELYEDVDVCINDFYHGMKFIENHSDNIKQYIYNAAFRMKGL